MPIKLNLKGYIRNTPYTHYHHWPEGTTMQTVEAEIAAYKRAFQRVSAVIEYMFDDL